MQASEHSRAQSTSQSPPKVCRDAQGCFHCCRHQGTSSAHKVARSLRCLGDAVGVYFKTHIQTPSCSKRCPPETPRCSISQLLCLQIGHLSLSASPNSVNLLMGLPQAVVDMLTLGSKWEQRRERGESAAQKCKRFLRKRSSQGRCQ